MPFPPAPEHGARVVVTERHPRAHMMMLTHGYLATIDASAIDHGRRRQGMDKMNNQLITKTLVLQKLY